MAHSRQFMVECLRDRPRLAKALLDFNRLLPSRLREGALPEALRPLHPLLQRDLRVSARLSLANQHLALPDAGAEERKKWGDENWIFDFSLPRHRLALLPGPLLLKLAAWFGLAHFRDEVAKLVRREDVLALREAVGDDGRAFALRRSALLPGLRQAPPAFLTPGQDAAKPLTERIHLAGFAAVAVCLTDAAPAIPSRLAATMPDEFADRLLLAAKADAEASEPEAAQVWPLLRTLIFKEIAPEWEPCFL